MQDDMEKSEDKLNSSETDEETHKFSNNTEDDSLSSNQTDNNEEKDFTLSSEEQIKDLKDQLLRALAETENVRRRTEKERSKTSKYAITTFARDVLNVADNLQRTLMAAESIEEGDEALRALMEGVEMTQRDLKATLERFEIYAISSLGEKFDHNHHQAIFEVANSEKEPGTVIEVTQEGYLIADRLLRPAMVGVSKAPTNENQKEDSPTDDDN